MAQERGEFHLIDRFRSLITANSQGILTGIGDDAAVLSAPSEKLLYCSDASVEGVHFDLSYTSPFEAGYKAAASCLSDIAAMGGQARFALITLALPSAFDHQKAEELFQGLAAPIQKYGAAIVGGDTTSSKSDIFIDVALIGTTRHPLLRSGARVGDLLAITGCPGRSAAGLAWLTQNGRPSHDHSYWPLCQAHLQPEPRFTESKALAGSNAVTSMIDVSDGLASELHHLARASGAAFILDESRLPIDPLLKKMSADAGTNPLNWVLHGGEDYELLMTLDSHQWEASRKNNPELERLVTVIGSCVPQSEGIKIKSRDGSIRPLSSKGWDHFR